MERRCHQCLLVKPITCFRPRSSYRIANGDVKSRGRSKICTKCEYGNWKLAGRCPRCKKPTDSVCYYCSSKRRERTERYKVAVLSHYGNECCWCGESLSIFLTIDHIDGGGKSVRDVGSYRRWKSIVDDGYPTGLRILCCNCNSGRAIYGDNAVILSNKGEFVSEDGSTRRTKEKLLVLNHYGGFCAICNQSAFVFLTIDHIGGGGRKHRLAVGNNMYRWLIKNRFPPGFRILCWNCNLASSLHGDNVVVDCLNRRERASILPCVSLDNGRGG